MAQKVHTKCAKLVDEKNNRLFCCLSVHDFEHIDQSCTSYKYWKKKFYRKLIFFLCHRTTFYSIFNMSSCRKPEINTNLPKITKIK